MLSVCRLQPVPRHTLTVPSSGLGSRSKFDVLVEKKERLLRKSVISYIGAASEFTGQPYLSVLSSPLVLTV